MDDIPNKTVRKKCGKSGFDPFSYFFRTVFIYIRCYMLRMMLSIDGLSELSPITSSHRC